MVLDGICSSSSSSSSSGSSNIGRSIDNSSKEVVFILVLERVMSIEVAMIIVKW